MNYELIDSLLHERGMSRRQLAIQAGIPESTMSSIFARKSQHVSHDTVNKIASVLGIEPFFLLFTEDALKNGLIGYKFADDKETSQSSSENNNRVLLLNLFDALNESGKQKALDFLDILSRVPDFRKGE